MPNEERQYFVLCNDNCRFESMTKEQIIAAIAEATGSTPTSIDDAFITKIKEMNANTNLKFWIGTTAQFNALATKAADTLYILSDDDTEESLETAIANLQTSINSILAGDLLLQKVYPIGSIYMSVNNVSPQSFLGGTWVAWGAGKVPVGVDTNDTDFDTVEETGGEKKHTLTTTEMPNHTHDIYNFYGEDASAQNNFTINSTTSARHTTNISITGGKGGNQAHNNLQPYITCYMWKRTA